MIHVEPAPEPARFHDEVRVPGLRAVAEMVGKPPPYPRTKGRPYARRSRMVVQPDGSKTDEPITREEDLPSSELHPYWTTSLDDLMAAYDEVCAYSCFRIHRVTGARSVDHFAPRSRAWNTVYEWSNYRLACSRLNARKRDFTDVLDPFEVQTGWFRLELVGFQLLPAVDLDARGGSVRATSEAENAATRGDPCARPVPNVGGCDPECADVDVIQSKTAAHVVQPDGFVERPPIWTTLRGRVRLTWLCGR